MTTAAKIEFKAAAQFNPVFRPVNEWRGRYRILKGSAGSGKSVNIAQDYIAKLSDPAYTGANLLVVRKIEETNRDSTFAELQAAIYRMFGPYADRFWKVNLNPLALECKITGNRIIFRGVKDQRQREKVKSITFKNGKLVWIWCEEATELLSEDVDILDDRLRGNLNELNPNLYYQITMTFNPVSATHWIKGRYFDKADPDVLAHHSTYKTNRFIDPAYFRRMERRKEEDPEGYRVYGLGEWGELGGLILTNFEVHDFKTGKDNFDAFYYGQDFGYRHLLDEGRIDFETILQSYSSWTGHAEHGNSYHLIRKTDDLFFNLFKNELEGLTYGKITIRFARWKRCQVDEHEIQRESDQVDRGNPGHSQRPNGPGDRENDHSEMLRREGAFEHER